MSVIEKQILLFLLVACVSGANAQTAPNDTVAHRWNMGMFFHVMPMKYGTFGLGPEAVYSYGLGYDAFLQTSVRLGYAGDVIENPSGRFYAALRASAGFGMNSPVYLSIGALYLQPFVAIIHPRGQTPRRADVLSKNFGIHLALGVFLWKINAALEMGGCRYFFWMGTALSVTIDQW